MKNFKFYMSIVAVLALLFTSCSKDDPGTDPKQEKEMVTLSFKGALEQFSKAMASKQADNPIPSCKEDQVPSYIVVAIKDGDGNWLADESPEEADDYWIEIDVIPASIDSDGDGANNYLTFEADELELLAGTYCLEYFAVHNAAKEQIWLAPREDEDYGPANFENFVEDALPICMELRVGTKPYMEVEVLCYDEHFARQYGYLFFDFEEVPLTYLCLFANICDENGRHFPGNIRVKVWEYSDAIPAVYNDDNLLVDVENVVERNENGDVVYAEPVCIPLPDREAATLVHMEVYSIDDQGNETLIEIGDFTEEETKSLLQAPSEDNPEGLENYLHLRYGPYCGENSDPCLVNNPMDYIDDFDAAQFNAISGTQYSYVPENYDFPGHPGTGDALYGEGTFTFTTNPRNVHPNWINEVHDGKMFILNGDADGTKPQVYFTLTDDDVCPDDFVYVTFELRNVFDGQSSEDVRLVVTSDGQTLPQVITADETEGWKKIGLVLKANASGQLDVNFIDDETAPSTNDFAMDNVIISNNVAIMTGLNQIIVQP